jgi:hypothetical protein
MEVNYLTPKADTHGAGLRGIGAYAVAPIGAGETVAAFGGTVVTRATLDGYEPARRSRAIQIDDDLFLVSAEEPDSGDLVNHCCDPSCGLLGNALLVAMRDIAAGEEITYDYATSDGSDYDEFECHCGAGRCRGTVTGDDWRLRDVQAAYDGWFSPYLARRIAAQSSAATGGWSPGMGAVGPHRTGPSRPPCD